MKDFEAATGSLLQEHRVRHVMHEQLELRYRKIVRLAPQANSSVNLFLR